MKKRTTLLPDHTIHMVLSTGLIASLLLSSTTVYASENPAASWIDSDIVGNVTADTVVSEKDDFAAAVNQEWLSTTSIPDGYASYSAFGECDDLLKERKQALIGNPDIQNHNEELVTDLYNLATDWDARNADGLDSLKPYLDAIDHIETLDQLTVYLSNAPENLTGSHFFDLSVSVEAQNTSKYCLQIDEVPLLYEYPDDYEELSDYGQLTDQLNREIADYMLGRLGWTQEEAEDLYDSVIDFESTIAPYKYTEEELSSSDIVEQSIHEYSFEDLIAQVSVFPLEEILTNSGYPTDIVYNVSNPRTLELLDQIYTEENLENIKNYLYLNTILYCPSRFDQDAYNFVNDATNEIYGVTGTLSLEDYGYNIVDAFLPYVIDYLYIDEWCTEETRDSVLEMAGEFRDYFVTLMKNEDWLSEETRQEAVAKLDTLRVEAIYPDKRYDYSDLSLHDLTENGTYFEATQRIEQFNLDLTLELIKHDVDPEYWDMQTSVYNAYYDATTNSVVILAGSMVPPVYSDDMSFEEKMAAYTTFGHEITHAFDTTGSQFDKDGNFNMWWTEEDYASFQDRADTVASYMDRIIPQGSSEAVNGSRVESEMIADLGGLKAALALAREYPDFDYDKFFRAYAMQWRELYTDEMRQQLMATDAHPLNYLRVNVALQQFQEFYDTYGIEPGDGMYLAPEERLSVW